LVVFSADFREIEGPVKDPSLGLGFLAFFRNKTGADCSSRARSGDSCVWETWIDGGVRGGKDAHDWTVGPKHSVALESWQYFSWPSPLLACGNHS